MMAFRIAWFKVHRPLEFYSAYFYRRSQKDAFDAGLMLKGRDFVRRKINEIKSKSDATAKEEDLVTTLEAVYEFYMRGFEFAPMDLYECDAAKFLVVDEKRLRPPFVAISAWARRRRTTSWPAAPAAAASSRWKSSPWPAPK